MSKDACTGTEKTHGHFHKDPLLVQQPGRGCTAAARQAAPRYEGPWRHAEQRRAAYVFVQGTLLKEEGG